MSGWGQGRILASTGREPEEEVVEMATATKETAKLEFQDEALGESRTLQIGDMTVAFERWKAGTDTRPLYANLPGGACPANHYGYVLKGRARVLTEAGEEIVQAGQAYHMPPGHNVIVEEDAELVEFTPVEAERGVEHVTETRAGA
jgi:mannose-6-phosphate isomerase-like protein (cupin superfamily)